MLPHPRNRGEFRATPNRHEKARRALQRRGLFQSCERVGGAEGDRTPDLCSAIAALSQLSYSPVNHLGRFESTVFPKNASITKTPHVAGPQQAC